MVAPRAYLLLNKEIGLQMLKQGKFYFKAFHCRSIVTQKNQPIFRQNNTYCKAHHHLRLSTTLIALIGLSERK